MGNFVCERRTQQTLDSTKTWISLSYTHHFLYSVLLNVGTNVTLLLLSWILVVQKPPWHSSPNWRLHGIVSDSVFFFFSFQKTWFCLIKINALLKNSDCFFKTFLNALFKWNNFWEFWPVFKKCEYRKLFLLCWVFLIYKFVLWWGVVILIYFIIWAWPKKSSWHGHFTYTDNTLVILKKKITLWY